MNPDALNSLIILGAVVLSAILLIGCYEAILRRADRDGLR